MTTPTKTLIARTKERDSLRSVLGAAHAAKGQLMCIGAESGYGKTMLLETVVQESRVKREVDVVRVECQAPIGALNVASIQPMQPWLKALESLVELNAGSAKKRLAVNIGLSVLGLIPIAGSIFDMTKEVMRDLREYRADKRNSQDATQSGTKLFSEFYDALSALARQHPISIFLDDAQWMDAQSVEFLDFLVKKSEPLAFSVVIAYQQATVQVKNPALLAWLQQHASNDKVHVLELQAFHPDEIRQAVQLSFPRQARNSAFEEWLLRRSAGVPITLMEYLQYFQQHSPFREDGSLDSERLQSQAIPASLQALFARSIEQLSEADINVLSLCSAEGRECSVYVISQLMNLDTLATIKKLKSLQYRTGMLRSTGAQARYGVKTTIYEFTQALHHSYFHSTLEMEERVELHERIASILQKCFRDTEDEQLKRQLAPYIAAHALEAGDEATARNMLVHSAEQAEESGSSEVMSQILQAYTELSGNEKDFYQQEADQHLHAIAQHMGLEEAPDYNSVRTPQPESSQLDIPDCNIVRDDILEYYFNAEFAEAARRAEEFLALSGSLIQAQDHVLILAMAARAEIEAEQYEKSYALLQRASIMLESNADDYAQCIVDNVRSIWQLRRGYQQQSLADLQHAAQSASQLSDDLKLLTISNISLALRSSNQRQSKLFERIAKQLCSSLHFTEFSQKVFARTRE